MSSIVTLNVTVRVTDEGALRQFTAQSYEAAWGPIETEAWLARQPSLGEIVYEALVASNANPSPDTYGIEILKGHHFETFEETAP